MARDGFNFEYTFIDLYSRWSSGSSTFGALHFTTYSYISRNTHTLPMILKQME